jgi:hypothetical protein
MSYRFDGFARVRVALELSDKRLASLSDFGGDPARFPRGAKVRFEFLFLYNGEIVDTSLLSLPRLRILSTEDPDSALAIDSNNGTVYTKGDVTLAQWQTGDPAMCHFSVEFTSTYTQEGVFTGTLADEDSNHWFLISAGAGADFVAAGLIKSFDAGYNPAAGTPPATGTGATIESIEALITARLAGVVRFSGNPAGAVIELTSPSAAYKVKVGSDDEGNLYTPTQVVT